MPFFSIIIATYNRAKYINIAIESVIKQTVTDWELIIVDDGSTDRTRQIISPYLQDKRIKYIYQENKERSVARNTGISSSKGEYICFLDSDDYYLPHHLQTFVDYLKNNGTCEKDILCVSRSIKRDKKEEIIWFKNVTYFSNKDELLERSILESPPIQCICLHKSFSKNVRFKNDWIPFECNQFIFDLLKNGYHNKFIPVHSVVMVSHDENSTAYSEDFLKMKLNFIRYYSKITNTNRQFVVKKTIGNMLMLLAPFEKRKDKKITLQLKAYTICPSLLLQSIKYQYEKYFKY